MINCSPPSGAFASIVANAVLGRLNFLYGGKDFGAMVSPEGFR